MIDELILTDEEIKRLDRNSDGRIELDEEDILDARVSLKDMKGNPRGSVELRLSDFQYIGNGKISARYEVVEVYRD